MRCKSGDLCLITKKHPIMTGWSITSPYYGVLVEVVTFSCGGWSFKDGVPFRAERECSVWEATLSALGDEYLTPLPKDAEQKTVEKLQVIPHLTRAHE